MQNLQLGWQPAAALSLGLAAAAVASAYRGGRAARLAPYLRESALVAGLYSLWQLAASVSVLGPAGALVRGNRIADWEKRWLPLPSERTVQRLITGHPLLAQGANWYYAAMHFTALGALLLWLFARHRDRYPRVRNVLVVLTASSLLIQLVPVAPPRLLPQLGFVDTAAQYGQSVYAISGNLGRPAVGDAVGACRLGAAGRLGGADRGHRQAPLVGAAASGADLLRGGGDRESLLAGRHRGGAAAGRLDGRGRALRPAVPVRAGRDGSS